MKITNLVCKQMRYDIISCMRQVHDADAQSVRPVRPVRSVRSTSTLRVGWEWRLMERLTDSQVKSFYHSTAWRHKRADILQRDHNECQLCKAHGKYRRAVIVHHVNHLRDHPDLALSDTYTDTKGKECRQLISVCRECHETVCHPERMGKVKRLHMLTQERW